MRRVTVADWKVTRYQKRLVKQVLKSGRLTYGDKTRELEQGFAELHGRKHALFTNSGTSALKIALHAFKDKYGWKDNDEVLIPALTFVATMNVVLDNNLKPKLVDIDKGLTMDYKLIEKAITKRTRAIIPVHLLGQSAEMDRIITIARKHNLKVIEDSCETMFVQYRGQPVGSLGDVACFSSYLAHLMVTGVGGFITTNDDEMATIMRSMMFHGRHESYLNIDDNDKPHGPAFTEMFKKRFQFDRQGYSDRATEMEAALGLGDLKRWPQIIDDRQDNAQYLIDNLGDLPVYFPVRDVWQHAFMLFPMLVPDRDSLVEYLEYQGIHTRLIMPLTNQPVVKDYFGPRIERRYAVAEFVNRNGLLVGCHQYLTKKDLDYMITKIRNFYA